MKTVFKAMVFLILPFSITSCSKDDDQTPDQSKSAIIEVVVENIGNHADFEEFVTIHAYGNDIKNTDISGYSNWEISPLQGNGKQFEKKEKEGIAVNPLEVKPKITYKTSNKVSKLTYAVSIQSKADVTTPLVSTITIFADGKQVGTETIKTVNGNASTSIPIVL